jgi:hypothetical protein
MLAQQLQYLAHGKFRFDESAGRPPAWNLEYVAKDLLGVEHSKADSPRRHYSSLIDAPLFRWSEDEEEYATVDAILPVQIYREQLQCPPTELAPTVEGSRVVNLAEQVAFSFAAKLMQSWGMRTDALSVRNLKETLSAEVARAMNILASETLSEIDGERVSQPWEPLVRDTGSRNMKAIKGRVTLAYNGFPPLTAKGLELQDKAMQEGVWEELSQDLGFWTKYAATNSDTLVDSGDPALQLLGRVLSSMAELNNFIPILENGTKYPVTPSYKTLQVTGRTSCSRPNMQNLPRRKGVRECFVARPGQVLLFCDYDSLEIRTFAQTCLDVVGRSTFATYYAKDPHWDPHSWFGANLIGLDYDEFLARKAEGDKEVKNARQLAKIPNFGIPGGMGWRTMVEYAHAYGVELSEGEARHLYDLWMELCEEADDYFGLVSEATGDWGHKIHLCHRSGRQRGGCTYTQYANNGFQGPAADLAKDATFKVSRECYTDESSPLYTCRPVQFIHDELILECPEDRVAWAGPRLAEIMVNVGKEWCPDVPLTAETAAAKFWSKDAVPVYNEHGLLIPWTPSDRK